jgi:hypothetical protein
VRGFLWNGPETPNPSNAMALRYQINLSCLHLFVLPYLFHYRQLEFSKYESSHVFLLAFLNKNKTNYSISLLIRINGISDCVVWECINVQIMHIYNYVCIFSLVTHCFFFKSYGIYGVTHLRVYSVGRHVKNIANYKWWKITECPLYVL